VKRVPSKLTPVWWDNDAVGYIDQRLLPHELVRKRAESVDAAVDAIRTLAVRGAPAIGLFAAYAVALARRACMGDAEFALAAARIRAARPTAVNLAWAVDRVVAAPDALAAAREIHAEEEAVDRAIAEHGSALMPPEGGVITHCNTGPLATGCGGTALGVMVEAFRRGKHLHVVVDETRPLLQGARLTTVELMAAGVPATVIVDGAAASAIGALGVRCAIVGADRIARNGDTANKIGTLGLALAAAHHRIPFYVAAPRSTVDFSIAGGGEIEIEQRDSAEVLSLGGVATVPAGAKAYNPAFDVTPGRLISGIVTEFGVCRPPYDESLGDLQTRPASVLSFVAQR
jgi:methylthioribose-1-phosphate isomerase